MSLPNTPDTTFQTRFSLEQAKVMSLNGKLKNHENKKELMETAKAFEGVFFKQLLDAMDKTVDRSGLFDAGSAEETFRGMMYDQIAESISKRPGGSGFGIAEAIYRQLENRLPHEEQSKNQNNGGDNS